MRQSILRIKEVMHRTGLPRSTLYREIHKKQFPGPVKLTNGRSVGWQESAVSEWIESREKKDGTF